MIYTALSFLCLLFNGLDIYLTRLILRSGGKELNPIMRSQYWIPIKIGVSLGLIVAGWLIHWVVLIAPVLVFAGACIWNLYQLLRKL